MGSEAMVSLSKFRGRCCGGAWGLVLHLLKELVSWILISVLLHLGEVALLWGHGGVNLESRYRDSGLKYIEDFKGAWYS